MAAPASAAVSASARIRADGNVVGRTQLSRSLESGVENVHAALDVLPCDYGDAIAQLARQHGAQEVVDFVARRAVAVAKVIPQGGFGDIESRGFQRPCEIVHRELAEVARIVLFLPNHVMRVPPHQGPDTDVQAHRVGSLKHQHAPRPQETRDTLEHYPRRRVDVFDYLRQHHYIVRLDAGPLFPAGGIIEVEGDVGVLWTPPARVFKSQGVQHGIRIGVPQQQGLKRGTDIQNSNCLRFAHFNHHTLDGAEQEFVPARVEAQVVPRGWIEILALKMSDDLLGGGLYGGRGWRGGHGCSARGGRGRPQQRLDGAHHGAGNHLGAPPRWTEPPPL